jgi:Zn finger protein HypA/HybF involved in hydrogenase expression
MTVKLNIVLRRYIKDHGSILSEGDSLKKRFSSKEKEGILKSIREKGLKEFTPSIGCDRRVSYPQAKEVFGRSEEILNQLVEENILEKFMIRCVPTCPKDNSILESKLMCPRCGSADIEKKLLIQDPLSRGLRLVSRDQLVNQNVDVKGAFFECRGCGNRFPSPLIKFYCVQCNMEYRLEDVDLMKMSGYRVLEKAVETGKEVEELKTVIREVMEEKGFNLENSMVEGKSGVKHSFDLYFRKVVDGKEHSIGVDIVVRRDKVSLEDLLPSLIKSHDINSYMIVVVMPPSDFSCKQLCLLEKNIFLIEGKNVEEIKKSLEKLTF